MLLRWLPTLSLFFAMALWASSFIALKLAFMHYDPMVVIFGRMLIGALCFIPFYKLWCRFEYRRGDLLWLAVMVIAEPCLYFVFEANALTYTSAAQAGMITAMAPLLVGIGAFFVLKERMSCSALFGFLVAVAGALWLSLTAEDSAHAPNPLLGNFLEFCAMVCAAVYSLALKHLSERYSPWFLTALQAFCGSVFFFPLLFLPQTTLPAEWAGSGVMAILYLGVFINIGAYGLYNFAVSKVKVSQASAFINLIPVITLLLAFIILDERMTFEQLLASGVVLAGVILSQQRSSESAPETASA